MDFRSSPRNLQKQRKKENRSFTGDPGLSMNHAITQKSWLLIWNPELFLILNQGPSRESEEDLRLRVFRPTVAMPAARDGWGSTRGSPRICWSPWMAGTGPVVGDGGSDRWSAAPAGFHLGWAHVRCAARRGGGTEMVRLGWEGAEQRALWQVRAWTVDHGGRGGVLVVSSKGEAREDTREEWGARHPLWRAGARVGMEQGAGHAVLLHGGHALDACHSLWHFVEQLAGNRVTSVGDKFGPFPCRIRRWAKYEVCQTRPDLHLLFKCHGH